MSPLRVTLPLAVIFVLAIGIGALAEDAVKDDVPEDVADDVKDTTGLDELERSPDSAPVAKCRELYTRMNDLHAEFIKCEAKPSIPHSFCASCFRIVERYRNAYRRVKKYELPGAEKGKPAETCWDFFVAKEGFSGAEKGRKYILGKSSSYSRALCERCLDRDPVTGQRSLKQEITNVAALCDDTYACYDRVFGERLPNGSYPRQDKNNCRICNEQIIALHEYSDKVVEQYIDLAPNGPERAEEDTRLYLCHDLLTLTNTTYNVFFDDAGCNEVGHFYGYDEEERLQILTYLIGVLVVAFVFYGCLVGGCVMNCLEAVERWLFPRRQDRVALVIEHNGVEDVAAEPAMEEKDEAERQEENQEDEQKEYQEEEQEENREEEQEEENEEGDGSDENPEGEEQPGARAGSDSGPRNRSPSLAGSNEKDNVSNNGSAGHDVVDEVVDEINDEVDQVEDNLEQVD